MSMHYDEVRNGGESLMKKIKMLLAITTISLFAHINVFALDDVYYRNNNGVDFTEKEYNYFYDVYGISYIDNMTQEDFNWYSDFDINNSNIETETYYDIPISIMSTTHKTASKKITITKSCSSVKCTINISLKWLTNPTIRSYDVIGVRFNGTSLQNSIIDTKVRSSAGTSSFNNLNSFISGFGVSVKLPESATNIIIDQKFYTTTSGKIYASYQHATSNVTLATSKLYTISSSGYGGVFNFYSTALNKYDKMGGVNITL